LSVRVTHFTAPWCGPCKPVEAALRDLAESLPFELVVVDLDASPEIGARYGVLALPTVVIERDGEVVSTLDGARRRGDYERALREVIPAA
jgi:thioredoxin-like negative regulator of GroEL